MKGSMWESVVRDCYDSPSAKDRFGYDHLWVGYDAHSANLVIVLYFGEEHFTGCMSPQVLQLSSPPAVANAIEQVIQSISDEFYALLV